MTTPDKNTTTSIVRSPLPPINVLVRQIETIINRIEKVNMAGVISTIQIIIYQVDRPSREINVDNPSNLATIKVAFTQATELPEQQYKLCRIGGTSPLQNDEVFTEDTILCALPINSMSENDIADNAPQV